MLDHVVSADQFDRAQLEEIFTRAALAETMMKSTGFADQTILSGKTVFSFFWEASTRTHLSFQEATEKLGGRYKHIGNAGTFSSFAKGESLEDTIRVFAGYHPDAIVMRSSETGFAARAAAVSTVPIINAGDGEGEHPTQALLDVYTIEREIGRVDGLKIAFVGDLKYGRTVHSDVRLLANCYQDLEMYFVAADEFQLPVELLDLLRARGITFIQTDRLDAVSELADVLYMTRTQYERIMDDELREEAKKNRENLVVDERILGLLPQTSRILHPLPRNDEIPQWITEASDPRLACFRQSDNGLYVRMALLWLMIAP